MRRFLTGKNILGLLAMSYGLAICLVYAQKMTQHQPLKFKNEFSDPTDVVRYYVGRDASGFVWSGFLNVERKAFTNWKNSPKNESFLIAKEFEVKPAVVQQSKAEVTVEYQIMGMSDAHGTLSPSSQKKKSVTFQLVQNEGKWKIDSPKEYEIEPVLLVSLVPYLSQ